MTNKSDRYELRSKINDQVHEAFYLAAPEGRGIWDASVEHHLFNVTNKIMQLIEAAEGGEG